MHPIILVQQQQLILLVGVFIKTCYATGNEILWLLLCKSIVLLTYTSYLSGSMQIKPGIVLISLPAEDELLFDKAVIFITEYTTNGALGFVINKLFPRSFNELTEFKHARPLPLYYGGPVEQEHLFFLHRRPEVIEGGTAVTDNVYFGGNFKHAVQCNTNNSIADDDMQLFIGYCGWDAGQLEEEITEGSWLVVDNGAGYVFKLPDTIVWEDIFRNKM